MNYFTFQSNTQVVEIKNPKTAKIFQPPLLLIP